MLHRRPGAGLAARARRVLHGGGERRPDHDACPRNYDESCRGPVAAATAGAFVLGVIGFGLGALIGGQFSKP